MEASAQKQALDRLAALSEQTARDLVARVTCNICLEMIRGEVSCCANEHPLCQRCLARLKRSANRAGSRPLCPVCRDHRGFLRSRLAEDLATLVSGGSISYYPCPRGCGRLIQEHLKTGVCPRRPFTCPGYSPCLDNEPCGKIMAFADWEELHLSYWLCCYVSVPRSVETLQPFFTRESLRGRLQKEMFYQGYFPGYAVDLGMTATEPAAKTTRTWMLPLVLQKGYVCLRMWAVRGGGLCLALSRTDPSRQSYAARVRVFPYPKPGFSEKEFQFEIGLPSSFPGRWQAHDPPWKCEDYEHLWEMNWYEVCTSGILRSDATAPFLQYRWTLRLEPVCECERQAAQ